MDILTLKSYPNIVLYGAGAAANILMRKFRYDWDMSVSHIVVADKSNNPSYILDARVTGIDDLKVNKDNTAIVVATFEDKQPEIKKFLQDRGWKKIFIPTDEFINTIADMTVDWRKEQRKRREVNYRSHYLRVFNEIAKWGGGGNCIHLPDFSVGWKSLSRLVVVLGTKCSLRCKHCNNLIPYFSSAYDIDEDLIIKSLEKFFSVVKNLQILELIGGEPFLARNFSDVYRYVVDLPNIKHLEITTSATVMPKDDVLSLLTHNKVEIRISDYHIPERQAKFIDRLQEMKNIRLTRLQDLLWTSPR